MVCARAVCEGLDRTVFRVQAGVDDISAAKGVLKEAATRNRRVSKEERQERRAPRASLTRAGFAS